MAQYKDDDIFGAPMPNAPKGAAFKDDDIFKPMAMPEQVPMQTQPQTEQPHQGGILNSPVGGFLRGLLDVPEGFGQAVAHVLPEGAVNAMNKLNNMIPGMTQLDTTKGAAAVDALVRANEQAYKQDWRQGQDTGIDVGRIGGNIAGTLVLPMGVPTTVVKAVATGAVMGGMQPVTGDDYVGEKAGQVALGAAGGGIGYGLGKVAGTVINPVGQRTAPPSQAVDAANRLGIELTPGQRTGSTGLLQLDQMFAKNPATSGAVGERLSRNQVKMNQAAGSEIGVDSVSSLSEDVLAGARSQLKKKYGDLTADKIVRTSDDFLATLSRIDANNKDLSSFASKQIDDLVNQGLELAENGQLSGKSYQSIRSTLNSRADDAFKSGNSELGNSLKQMVDGLDNAAKSELDDAGKAMWDLTRKQYSSLKTLEKGQVVQAGDVVPSRVAGELRRKYPDAYKEGKLSGGLMDIARVGESFKNAVPSLEASQPTLWNQMVFGNPLTGIPAMAGAKTAYNVINSPLMQRYIEQGLLPVQPRTVGALGGLLGYGYSQNLGR